MQKCLCTCFTAQLIIISKERWKKEENCYLSTVISPEIVFTKTRCKKKVNRDHVKRK